MSVGPAFTIEDGSGRLVAAALHAGHDLRAEVADVIALDDATRRREEDPGTDRLTEVAPTRIVSHRSRFEVDFNRPRDQAVYRNPEDSWGLEVWRCTPEGELFARSLAIYDEFYNAIEKEFDALAGGGRFLVLDLHSYNHRRRGHSTPAPEGQNPEVNVGTGTLDRVRWGAVVDRFMDDLGRQDVCGHRVDVRENVRFRGGHFARWIHARYPDSAVVLAVELKKTFTDEWSGDIDFEHLDQLRSALSATTPATLGALDRCKER